MTILLCDIGGTHIRFAASEESGAMTQPEKLRVDRHASLEDAVGRYVLAQSLDAEAITHFYLACTDSNNWERNEAKLHTVVPRAVFRQVNDFEANAMGIAVAPQEDLEPLYPGGTQKISGASRVVMGVGTGLGLAYIFEHGGVPFIQKTYGGHMLPATVKPEHQSIFSALVRPDVPTPIYENVLSGGGLFALYRLVCHRNQLNTEYHDTSDLLISGKDDPVMRQTLILFHEILGIFAHQAVAFGYGYGGVYLTGGIIDRLMAAGLFDTATFLANFRQPSIPVVMQHVMDTPLYWVRDEFISLRGLLKQAREDRA
jgi:glucokinase